MAGPRGAQGGLRAPRSLQVGVDVPELGGMVREGDPASIPDASFHHLENARWKGGMVVDRPGQVRVTNVVTGPIEGMYDTADVGAPQ